MPRIIEKNTEPNYGVVYRCEPPDHVYLCTMRKRSNSAWVDEFFRDTKRLLPEMKSFSSNNWGQHIFLYFLRRLSQTEWDDLKRLVDEANT